MDVIKRGHDAFNRGDWDGALEFAHPEIEWRLHGELGLDAAQAVKGREALKELWASFFEIWDEYKMDALDFAQAPAGRVLVSVRFTALGQGSSVPIELTYFWVYRMRDGVIAAVDLYLEKSEALEAAGLA